MAHSPTHLAGTGANWGKKDNATLFQRVATVPGVEYMAQTYIWTQNWKGDWTTAPTNTTARIGVDPLGGTDPNASTVQWNITGDTWSYTQDLSTGAQLGWQPISLFVTAQAGVATVFLQVKHKWADRYNITAFDDVGFAEASPASTVAQCKAKPAGWPVEMTGRLVTYVYYGLSPAFCYVEDDDRVAGIKVPIPEAAPVLTVGDRIDIVGTTAVVDNEAQVTATSIAIGTPAGTPPYPPKPLALTSKSVDGGKSGLQPGIPGGTGLATTGLLLRVFGRCVAVDWTVNPTTLLSPFWVDDGSGVDGGSILYTGEPVKGLKVYYGFPTAPYSVGNYLLVTGVAGVEIYNPTPPDAGGVDPVPGDEYPIRVLYMRDDADVVDLGPH
jgi:hypothetical protein